MWARQKRLSDLFDAEDAWTRPLPENYLRADAILALAMFACSALGLEILRSMGVLGGESAPLWAQYTAMASAAALLALRRRLPLLTGLGATAHLLIIGSVMPLVMGQVSQQVLYFIAVYSAVAWARDRRALVGVAVAIAAALVVWMTWYLALGSGMQQILDSLDDADRLSGLVPPVPAYLVYTALINIVYFGGAAALGIASWRGARRRHALADQAETIEEQAEALRDRAVVEERLRIARELHDVIAHHVAAIGVQAGAARRVMGHDPDAAAGALRTVEESSRSAVGEMRALLGALRSADRTTAAARPPGGSGAAFPDDPSASPDHSRSAGHGIADLGRLAASHDSADFTTSVSVVTGTGHPVEEVPPVVGLSLYRTAQEALANVRRHSTADRASMVLRTGEGPGGNPYAEVEILDAGRPRAGTSGSGLGLLGMRERVRSHGGECEIGPRVTGGYRVRVRLPYHPDVEGDRT
ncbi:histidine kinase [Dietzia natronolimnaea]|uniref:histidine kinase n=1 Tax=Dietzia natronolimnaea TaxID=161920 RepID=A0A2A2WN44_9ACTN|nr:histidine kinase [Dietzia natronolimnaea]PAY22610.1 histidine kinase [Dietzia natronolimnaea]